MINRRQFGQGGLAATLAAVLRPLHLSAAEATPVSGGTLNWVFYPDPSALIAINTSSGTGQTIGTKINEGLLAYDYDLKPKPVLARSFTISEDGRRYSFGLRPGVKWSDGHEFTSADVAFSIERLKVAAAVLFFAPYLPLLFMGQEYGETAPFYYFTSHGDPALIEAVREGRRQEIGAFLPAAEFADPQDIATFERSKLNWNLLRKKPYADLLAWYRDCIATRKRHPALHNCRKDLLRAECDSARQSLVVERGEAGPERALLVCNFSETRQAIPIPFRPAPWSLSLWSGAARYGPPAAEPPQELSGVVELPATSAALYLAP